MHQYHEFNEAEERLEKAPEVERHFLMLFGLTMLPIIAQNDQVLSDVEEYLEDRGCASGSEDKSDMYEKDEDEIAETRSDFMDLHQKYMSRGKARVHWRTPHKILALQREEQRKEVTVRFSKRRRIEDESDE